VNASIKESLVIQLTLIISIGLFTFSLSQECFCTGSNCGGSWSGLAILFSGALGFYLCPAGFTWLANPAILIAWTFIRKNPKRSLSASIIAFLLAISFLFFPNIVSDESGNMRQITAYHLGYWFWLASMLSVLSGNLIVYFQARSLISHNNQAY